MNTPASGRRGAYDEPVRFGGIAIAVLLAGCFEPGLASDQFQCMAGLCPEGFRCEAGWCVEGAGGDDPIDAAVDDPPDAGDVDAVEVAADAMPAPCYGVTPVPITLGQTYSGDTSINNYDNADGCNNGPTARGDEEYYELVLGDDDVPVTLVIDVQGNYDIVLRMRQGICDSEAAEFLCQDTGGDENRVQPIDTAGTYYILVDGHAGSGGSYDLVVSVQ